jgi:hypothetical protein
MTIIEFHITKFNNHDHMIFGDRDHPSMTIVMKILWNDINDYCHGINNYNHGCN